MSNLPEPSHCDRCASLNIQFCENKVLYHGKNYGKWPWCWYCNDCGAAVGCHSNTRLPLGTMTDAKTRLLRRLAHDAFDPLWRDRYMKRSQAYGWLARQLNITTENCHISQMSREQLKLVIELSKKHIAENGEALKRRMAKYEQRNSVRNERELRTEKRHAFGKKRRR
jgi:hypothetical protein